MKKYRLYQVDAFTKEIFKGNPAGVVTNADGLTEIQMQQIARELNNSETVFIFQADNPNYTTYLRYFTPTNEVPICGHATIAAHYVRALENNLASQTIYHKTGAGILPVHIEKLNNDYKITMVQGQIEFGDYLIDKEKTILLKALGLSETDLLTTHPIQIVSTGHSKVLIGIKDINLLHNLQPEHRVLSELSQKIDCNGYYVYTFDPTSEITVNGRMFAPAIGITEDPVTGNANGPLGAYLIQQQLVKTPATNYSFKAKQGEAIARTGIIEVNVRLENHKPLEVSISGNAVIAFQTELLL